MLDKKKKRILLIEKLLNQDKLRILIWGYGVTGRSFLSWALKFLSLQNKYIIVDKKEVDFPKQENISFIFETDIEKNINLIDIILPSPGILLNQSVEWYSKIIPELDLFYYFWNKFQFESIIITGSIGKTSTTTMISHYLSFHFSSFCCGNIGIPIFDFLFLKKEDYKNKPNIAIIEASNLQLEHSLLSSPKYFIITNLYKNHLNMHDSYQSYIKSKLSPLIYNELAISKILCDKIAYEEIYTYFKDLIYTCQGKFIIINDYEMINIPSLSFLNNWKTVSLILFYYNKWSPDFYVNYPLPIMPEFRLEKIYDNNNVIIFNDSKSTVIESSLSAIKKIKSDYPKSYLFVIIGGTAKGVCRFQGIIDISFHCHELLFIGKEENMHNRIKQFIEGKKHCIYEHFINLEYAIIYINNRIKTYCIQDKVHVVILFSPGGASFDFYESYVDRGNKFNTLIKDTFI